MTDRIKATFDHLASQGRKALIPYVTGGFPTREVTVPLMHAMAEAGANIIELGVPFSDPMADGPVIQQANDKALMQGIGMTDVLEIVRAFRTEDGRTPIVLMGYMNPIEAMGMSVFIEAARAAGVDGLIVVDCPPEESAEFSSLACEAGIAPIFLVAPTSTKERIEAVARMASGYVYYVSLKGTTGAATLDVDDVRTQVAKIRHQIPLPIGVGFGIRDAETAKAVAEAADAVVIGSKVIQIVEDGEPDQAVQRVRDFIGEIRDALDELAPSAGERS
ncbi:MAG: tryptophan synthase subunit alpha [Burkholderiaceae bacterium]